MKIIQVFAGLFTSFAKKTAYLKKRGSAVYLTQIGAFFLDLYKAKSKELIRQPAKIRYKKAAFPDEKSSKSKIRIQKKTSALFFIILADN